MKVNLLNLLPGVRWTLHGLPPPDSGNQKAKLHRLFFNKSSKSKSSLEDTSHGLLYARQSTLSLTSEPDVDLDARTHAQGQSLFFSMLPTEIREMVYEYVMGGGTLHLISAKKRFKHFVCEDHLKAGEGREERMRRECGCRVLTDGRESKGLDMGCLSLVRCCRRMYVSAYFLSSRTGCGRDDAHNADERRYSEAISHLYRSHTFSLLHITHLLYLPSAFPQPRLNNIRTLHLRWAIRGFPYLRRGPTHRLAYREDTVNWKRGWGIIAGMEGLRNLYVAVVDPSPHDMWEGSWLESEELLLQPVKEVVRPRWFELMLPFASCGIEWDMGESRCVLRKPEGWLVEEVDVARQ
jgi:hypothetical protein